MTKIPPLKPCPKCGLRIQAGKGPDGLSWHDCAEVQQLRAAAKTDDLTVEQAAARVLAVAVKKAPAMPPKDLVALVGHVAAMRTAGGTDAPEAADEGSGRRRRGKGKLLDFLRSDDPGEAEEATAPPVHALGG